jgi:potassium-transporting ATPase potassium-binding subunit
MSGWGWGQIALYLFVLLALAKPLGSYMTRVFESRPCGLDRLLGPLERAIYRVCGIDARRETTWKEYASAFLAFNLLSLLVVHAILRLQHLLPLNPGRLGPVSPDSSFDTAVSFATNTDWQGYAGETTMSFFTQMFALTVQNFVSAAAGIAVLVALIRGFARRSAQVVGNFWVDLTRATLYVLLPLSLLLAAGLLSQGVVQTFRPGAHTLPLQAEAAGSGAPAAGQVIALGPAASQVAIKQLGTNGGGFFNANSAHPFENPTPTSNFLELIAILLIPAALCFTFGRMVRDARQGRALLAAMVVIFVPLVALAAVAEQSGNPLFARLGVDAQASALQSGGNMEGKEVRFGIANSALWATATTAASNGSVNAMHDSFTPLGGLCPLALMQIGEVVFGGVGSGLYGMLAFAIVAVFVAGLMVGRTPEYLGKKIEAFEMKMASLAILAPCFAVLIGAAVAAVTAAGKAGVANPGAHGFSEILYAFSSAGNNNGSAFAGLDANTPFYNLALALAMLVARYVPAVAMLAIAGSVGRKNAVPEGPGTLPTHGPLFVALLVGVVLLVGALTFLPGLALGPIVEHLQMVAAAGAPR